MAQQMVARARLEQFCKVECDVTKSCTKTERDVKKPCKLDHDVTKSCAVKRERTSPTIGVVTESPTKRNKRKLSEPRKHTTDFSIKRFCPDSPVGSVADSENSDDRSEHMNETLDLSLKAKPNKCRTQLKVPVVPFQNIHCRTDDYFAKSTTRGFEVMSPPTPEVDSRIDTNYSHFPRVESTTTPVTSRVPPPHPEHHHVTHTHPLPDHHHVTHTHPALEHHHATHPIPDDPHVDPAHPSRLAAHILTVNQCPSDLPTQRFGHYPAEHIHDDPDMDPSSAAGKNRKNYKNMTRARRVEANARERTRVHTISAAFEALRRAVPSYSYNQKLSKLAILRIASTYILSLARLADMDAGHNSAPESLSFSECVDLCTQTIQTEGRARRRH